MGAADFLGHRIEGKQARIFPGTGLLAGWANLGREGNWDTVTGSHSEQNATERRAIDIR